MVKWTNCSYSLKWADSHKATGSIHSPGKNISVGYLFLFVQVFTNGIIILMPVKDGEYRMYQLWCVP